MVIRNRNAEDRERKENIRKMREDDAAIKAERNAQRRLEELQRKSYTGQNKAMKVMGDASRTKEESLKNAISINR